MQMTRDTFETLFYTYKLKKEKVKGKNRKIENVSQGVLGNMTRL